MASTLGLSIRRPLSGGIFGAVLVDGPAGLPLVLKVQPNEELAPVWATGAEMAARLRARDYPAPRYEGTGRVAGGVWSLQAHLAGAVPERLTESCAAQLVSLIGAHAIDSGQRRPWRDEALAVARGWLGSVELPGDTHAVLEAALARTSDVDLAETTIVHGDFHHRNVLVDDEGRVGGVFDWEIAGAGDWRFDLATLAFWCLLYPSSCEPGAIGVATDALTEHCAPDVATFMLTCQTLRVLSLEAARRPDRLAAAGRHLLARLHPWLDPGRPS